MSSTTFLLILAGVIVVFIGYVVKSWSELGDTARRYRKTKRK